MSHREVMQQALEAIRIFREWEMGQDYESCRATVLARALAAEESLGAALAEPEQDVELSAALGWPGGISTPILDRHVLLDLVAKQRSAALAEFGADPQNVGQTQTESKQEPVIDGYPLCSGMPQRQPQEPRWDGDDNIESPHNACMHKGYCLKLKAQAPQRQPHEPSRELLEALQIIAAPQRPDGSWNRDREACRQLAAEVLGFHNKGVWK